MSGGAWDYLQDRLEEEGLRVKQAMTLLGALEHELDWGVSGDTCLDCAKNRVVAALIQFYNDGARSASAALSIARDEKQNRCTRHDEGEPK